MAPRKDSASPAERPQGGATAAHKAALKSGSTPLAAARTIERAPPRDRAAPASAQAGESLEQCVFRSLEQYFSDLDGAKPHALHEMVLGAIEKPLLQFALQRCEGNQSAAADLLGINRNTLRRKLQDYGLH
jgi:Fis family transcriptional regulator